MVYREYQTLTQGQTEEVYRSMSAANHTMGTRHVVGFVVSLHDFVWMEVRVCTDTNTKPWTEAALFVNNTEVARSERHSYFFGTWELKYDGDIYIAHLASAHRQLRIPIGKHTIVATVHDMDSTDFPPELDVYVCDENDVIVQDLVIVRPKYALHSDGVIEISDDTTEVLVWSDPYDEDFTYQHHVKVDLEEK